MPSFSLGATWAGKTSTYKCDFRGRFGGPFLVEKHKSPRLQEVELFNFFHQPPVGWTCDRRKRSLAAC